MTEQKTLDDIQSRFDAEEDISREAYRKLLIEVYESATDEGDDDERRKAAFLVWILDNDNDVQPNEIDPTSWNDKEFAWGKSEYLVLTDEEADEAVEEYIKESLWAFRAEFLGQMTDLPAEVFQALGEKCEDGNDPILRIVEKTCGLKNFTEEAVRADGRGHFLGRYDGEEREVLDFYVYQTN